MLDTFIVSLAEAYMLRAVTAKTPPSDAPHYRVPEWTENLRHATVMSRPCTHRLSQPRKPQYEGGGVWMRLAGLGRLLTGSGY